MKSNRCPSCSQIAKAVKQDYQGIPVYIMKCMKRTCKYEWLPIEEEKKLTKALKERDKKC